MAVFPCWVSYLLRTSVCPFQLVSSSFLSFKPADNVYLGSSESEWLLCCTLFGLFTRPAFGSVESEWCCNLLHFKLLWWHLLSTLQCVSGCCTLLSFRPAKDAFSWLCSLWVDAMLCYISTLLMTPLVGSPGCEWWLYLVEIQTCWQLLSLLFSWWATAVPCHISALLTTFISLPLRLWVSFMPSCVANLLICLSLVLQRVSSCHALLHLKLLDDTSSLLPRGLVLLVLHCISSLLIALVLHSLEGKWFAVACNISGLLMNSVPGSPVGEWVPCSIFKPPDDTCLLFFRKWVIGDPYSISSLLAMFVLGLSVGQWLLCLAVYQACWQCLISTLQFVSCWHGLCIIAVLMIPILGFLCIFLSTSLWVYFFSSLLQCLSVFPCLSSL